MSCSAITATCRENAAGEKIYESTPYPPDQMILFHNESSHLPQLADEDQFFHCVIPAKAGGCTPVFDYREVLEAHRSGGLESVRARRG